MFIDDDGKIKKTLRERIDYTIFNFFESKVKNFIKKLKTNTLKIDYKELEKNTEYQFLQGMALTLEMITDGVYEAKKYLKENISKIQFKKGE